MKQVLFLFLITFSVTAFSQNINNKLVFPKGQKLEVYTQMNRSSTQELMGQATEMTVSSATTSLFDVKDVSDNAATIEASNKRIKFDFSGMGRSENFDSDNQQDMKGEVGKVVGKVLTTRYTMTVDPVGSVTAVKQDEDKTKKKGDDNAGMIGMMMGRMNMGTAVPKEGDGTIFKLLPDKEVTKGDTWTSESKDESGSRKTAYKIYDITDREILIDFSEEANLQTKQEMMGREMNIDVKAKSVGKIILDKETKLLKQKTFATTSEEKINAGGIEIPSTSKATTTITVKPV